MGGGSRRTRGGEPASPPLGRGHAGRDRQAAGGEVTGDWHGKKLDFAFGGDSLWAGETGPHQGSPHPGWWLRAAWRGRGGAGGGVRWWPVTLLPYFGVCGWSWHLLPPGFICSPGQGSPCHMPLLRTVLYLARGLPR